MINKNSIFFTITITFLVSLILITTSFIILYDKTKKRENHFIKKRDRVAAQIFLRECMQTGISDDLKNSIKELNYTIIENKKKINRILKCNVDIKKVIHKRRAKVTFFNHDDKSMIDIQTPLNHFILINNFEKNSAQQYVVLTIFFIIIFSFILLYLTTIKKLKPLRVLKQRMKNFANEDFNIDLANNKKDEISQLANEFDKTAKKLKSLREARNIFIRNIMHELKTPITKGKFIIELPNSKENDEKLQKVFYRLESLINEFAMIEKLISTKNGLNKKQYFFEDIVDNATDLLLCDEDELENDLIQEFTNIKLNIDFNLFSIAIKNLIDNGKKYSTNDKVILKTDENENIIIENIGKKLDYPLENYFEPFFKGDDVKSNQSFGLGLYIVKHILDAHGFELDYNYKDSVNRFTIYTNP